MIRRSLAALSLLAVCALEARRLHGDTDARKLAAVVQRMGRVE